MPGSSFFALFDDIASVLDDVAAMTKVAAKKTAGVLGDDLALNAQQVTGVHADRELSVVWAVAKGSFVNKLILVPSALAISALIPIAVTPLLMLGGTYLCFEGIEKIAHKLLHPGDHHTEEHLALVEEGTVDLAAVEQGKIKGAIRTDFILSAEIITISLGTVASLTLGSQVAVLSAIAVIMTIGVYGLVAVIVKVDDLGLLLMGSKGRIARAAGRAILVVAPLCMRLLSILGTVAMFMVGGGILVHGLPVVSNVLHGFAHHFEDIALLRAVIQPVLDAIFGVLVGAICLLVLSLSNRIFSRSSK